MESIRVVYERIIEIEAKIIACRGELDAIGQTIRTWALDDQVDVPGGIVEKKKRQLELYALVPSLRESLRVAKASLGLLLPSCKFHGPYSTFKTSTGWIARCDRCISEESGASDRLNEKIAREIIIGAKKIVAKAIAGKDEPFLEPELKKLVLDGGSDDAIEAFIIKTTKPPYIGVSTLCISKVKNKK